MNLGDWLVILWRRLQTRVTLNEPTLVLLLAIALWIVLIHWAITWLPVI